MPEIRSKQRHKGCEVFEARGKICFTNGTIQLLFSKETGAWEGLDENGPCSACKWDSSSFHPLIFHIGGYEKEVSQIRSNSGPDYLESFQAGTNRRYIRHFHVDCGDFVSFYIDSKEGAWYIREEFSLHLLEYKKRVRRRVIMKYCKNGYSDDFLSNKYADYNSSCNDEAILRNLSLNVKLEIVDSFDWRFYAPGYPVHTSFEVGKLPEYEWPQYGSNFIDCDSPAWSPGLFVLTHPKSSSAIMIWGYSHIEPSFMSIKKCRNSLFITQRILCADRISNGDCICTGSQYIEVFCGSSEDALHIFNNWMKEESVTVPDNNGEYSNLKIYETHIGQAVFKNKTYEPFPEPDSLKQHLREIKDMGFNTILIMPAQPFPSYTVHDYHDISLTYGKEEQLKALVEEAHKYNISVILDVVLHGCIDKDCIEKTVARVGDEYNHIFDEWKKQAHDYSPYRIKYPEWFMKDEEGNTALVYTAAFDHANQQWHDFIISILEYYIQQLDIDGFRVDAPTWNMMPNWSKDVSYRSSVSIYGAVSLFKKARARLERVKPNLLFFTEPCGPLFRTVFNSNYNYDEHWIHPCLCPPKDKTKYPGPYPLSEEQEDFQITAKDVKEWLYWRDKCMPQGSNTVHHVDSHDTFWKYGGYFAKEIFGEEPAYALFALSALIEGGVMVYAGAEKDYEEKYCNILRAKDEVHAIISGKFFYNGIQCSNDMIFTSMWRSCRELAVVCINFNNRHVKARIQTPKVPELKTLELKTPEIKDSEIKVLDYLNGDEIAGESLVDKSTKLAIETGFSPYQARLLVVRCV